MDCEALTGLRQWFCQEWYDLSYNPLVVSVVVMLGQWVAVWINSRKRTTPS